MNDKQRDLLIEVIILRMAELNEIQDRVATQFAKDAVSAEKQELSDILKLI